MKKVTETGVETVYQTLEGSNNNNETVKEEISKTSPKDRKKSEDLDLPSQVKDEISNILRIFL